MIQWCLENGCMVKKKIGQDEKYIAKEESPNDEEKQLPSSISMVE